MASEFNKPRHTNEKIKNKNILKPKKYEISSDETALFAKFIETQMEELLPNKKLYLTTKRMIKKVLLKSNLKISKLK